MAITTSTTTIQYTTPESLRWPRSPVLAPCRRIAPLLSTSRLAIRRANLDDTSANGARPRATPGARAFWPVMKHLSKTQSRRTQ